MELSEIKTLRDIAKETRIPVKTLATRLTLESFGMINGEDYRSLGERQPIILSPSGIKKITKK